MSDVPGQSGHALPACCERVVPIADVIAGAKSIAERDGTSETFGYANQIMRVQANDRVLQNFLESFRRISLLRRMEWTRTRPERRSYALAPKGELRAGLIASNPVLVTRGADGQIGGVSVELARALAGKLGVPVRLIPYENPARYNESLGKD